MLPAGNNVTILMQRIQFRYDTRIFYIVSRRSILFTVQPLLALIEYFSSANDCDREKTTSDRSASQASQWARKIVAAQPPIPNKNGVQGTLNLLLAPCI